MRVLLVWELGLNQGHLTRLLPVARRLNEEGNTVLIAARDLQAAQSVLGPAGIPFVQAPHLPKGISLDHRPAGYSDILLSQGWSDTRTLWGLVHAWLNLFRLFRPDKLVLDYSPTAALAARVAKIPVVLVGNGFELPPLTDPLRPFPGFSWAAPEVAARSERRAVENANTVLRVFAAPVLTALRDTFTDGRRLLLTYPELDHYGARSTEHYIGPLLARRPLSAYAWPAGNGPRLFACLRSDTQNVSAILAAFTRIPEARVVCVAQGFPSVAKPARETTVIVREPIDLSPLLDADLCVSYGAEGTMLTFIRAGVLQLVSPWHVEAFMAARRIEAAGVGRSVGRATTAEGIAQLALEMTRDLAARGRARAFGDHCSRGFLAEPESLVVQALHQEFPWTAVRCSAASAA